MGYDHKPSDLYGTYDTNDMTVEELYEIVLNMKMNSEDIEEGAIDYAHIKHGSIGEVHIREASINSAMIQDLAVSRAKIQEAAIGTAQIDDLAVTSAKIGQAQINNLHLDRATVNRIQIETADIEDLAVTSAKIGEAQINDLHFDRASGNKIQIIDGDIANVSASKLNAGQIDTSKVTIQGDNGHLRVVGNRLQVFDSSDIERVSIGDVNTDGSVYGFRLRGADGQTTLIDENGVYNEGITDGAITNPKIGDDAVDGRNIAAKSVTAEHMVTGTITAESGVIKDLRADVIIGGDFSGETFIGGRFEGATYYSDNSNGYIEWSGTKSTIRLQEGFTESVNGYLILSPNRLIAEYSPDGNKVDSMVELASQHIEMVGSNINFIQSNVEIVESPNEGTGVAVRATTNPASGDSIFSVESQGTVSRLRVEHDGAITTYNQDLRLDSNGTGGTLLRGSGGYLGIGRTPSYKLDVNGSIRSTAHTYVDGVLYASDRRTSGYMQTHAGGNVDFYSDYEMRMRNAAGSGYTAIVAADFITSSTEDLKQDITKSNVSALSTILGTDLWDYRLKSEVEKGEDIVHLGLVIGEGYNTPKEIINRLGTGIAQYEMNAYSWKAIQEQQQLIDRLEERVSELENAA